MRSRKGVTVRSSERSAGGARKRRGRRLAGVARGLLLLAACLQFGCATVGREFPVERVGEIRIGETTQEQVYEVFGSPWRVGLEDGLRTWTYGRYRYRLFGEARTEDLVIRFDDQGLVTSYTFNTTEHGE
ncbi:MAG: outer membrane protein assembly factor BamE [Candidatus Eisenbacteria bacterium]|nr:outer membrane protein assembly factor BamE [Candidatus Eisenbacteria bacterium]